MDRPISIVIPLYNKEEYVGRAISSVLSQTYTNFELIIVDDGSTDHSLEKAKKFEDKRVRIIRQKNLGLCAARNWGIVNCKYQFVSFLDADDYWENDFLKTISLLIDEFPQAGIYSTGRDLNYSDRTIVTTLPMQSGKASFIVEDYFKKLLNDNWGLHMGSNVVVRKVILEGLGLFPIVVSSSQEGCLYLLTGSGKLIRRIKSELILTLKGIKIVPADSIVIPEELRHIPDLCLIKCIPDEDLYLLQYIGLYHRVAYNNSLLAHYSGDVAGQLTRGKTLPLFTTIENLYQQIQIHGNKLEQIKYVKKYMCGLLFAAIMRTLNKKNYGDLATCLEMNHADYLMPVLNYCATHRLLYPIFRLAMVWGRYLRCRKIFKIIPMRLAQKITDKIWRIFKK